MFSDFRRQKQQQFDSFLLFTLFLWDLLLPPILTKDLLSRSPTLLTENHSLPYYQRKCSVTIFCSPLYLQHWRNTCFKMRIIQFFLISTYLNALTRSIRFSVSHYVPYSTKKSFLKKICTTVHTLPSIKHAHKPQKIHLFNSNRRIHLSYWETDLTPYRIIVIQGIRIVVHRQGWYSKWIQALAR